MQAIRFISVVPHTHLDNRVWCRSKSLGSGLDMKWLFTLALFALLAFCFLCYPIMDGTVKGATLTQHSYIFLNGYMDDTKIYQTEKGYHGQKLVTGTRGSGTVSRRQTVEVYSDNETGFSEMHFNEWGVFDYHPYTPGPSDSDLKNALCAKNYDVGSVFTESYSNIQQLVKDTDIYQNENVSVYLVDSYIHGTAKLGSKYKVNRSAVDTMVMGGVYVGEAKIQEELEVGDNPPLVLPCA